MRRAVHLIPYDGIGGVERAAQSAEGATRGDLRLKRMFVFETVQDRSGRGTTFDPRQFWTAAGRLSRAKPDLVILSLWRSVIVGMLAQLRGCRAPMVLFLHNARDAHALDRHVTRWGAKSAAAIWADSAVTLQNRLSLPRDSSTRIISYRLPPPAPVAALADRGDPRPDLIFWGRFAAQKNPLRMIALFARLHARRPDATLTLIGPDGGLQQSVREDIARRGLENAVTMTGPLEPGQIMAHAARASFYLQTSHYEGMALSVIEGMQAGLVPVVTPVGEIGRYTRDGMDAVWIPPATRNDGEDAATVERILALVTKPSDWHAMRQGGLAQLDAMPFYAQDIMDAAMDVLTTTKGRR